MEKGPIHQIQPVDTNDTPIKGLGEPFDPIGYDMRVQPNTPREPEATHAPSELQFAHWNQQRQPIS